MKHEEYLTKYTTIAQQKRNKKQAQVVDFLYGFAMLIAFLGLGYWGIVTITGGW